MLSSAESENPAVARLVTAVADNNGADGRVSFQITGEAPGETCIVLKVSLTMDSRSHHVTVTVPVKVEGP